MKSLLKRILLSASIVLLAPSVLFAVPLFNITPAPLVRPMFAGTGSQTFIEYQVQNTSGQALTGISYRVGPNAFLDTTHLTTCGSTLAAGATCIVALVYQAPGTKAQGTGEAPVTFTACVNGRSCEGPTSGNTVKLRVVPALKKVYLIVPPTTVSLVDTRTDAIVNTITLPAGTANGDILSPDLTRLYVLSTGPDAIYVVNTSTNAVSATITPTITPSSATVSPDATRLYVSSAGTANNIIDTTTNTVLTTPVITWGSAPGANNIIINKNGSRVLILGVAGEVFSANTLTGVVTTIVTLTGIDDRIIISPDGQFAYVSQPNTNATIEKVNLATGGVTAIPTTLPVVSNDDMTTSVDGRFLYVANNTSALGIIDTTSNAQIATLVVPATAIQPEFTPAQAKMYLINGAAGTLSIFKDNVITGTLAIGASVSQNSVGKFVG